MKTLASGWLANNLQIAEQKARTERTPEAIDLYKRMGSELNNQEMEIYGKRCERYPTNLGFKYELAVRLQRGEEISRGDQAVSGSPQRYEA